MEQRVTEDRNTAYRFGDFRLVPSRQLLLRARYEVVLKGTSGGLTDSAGKLLDGDRDGKAGGDFARVIDQRDLAGPAPNFRGMAASKLAARKRK